MPYIRPYQPDDKPVLIEIFRLNTPHYFAPSEEQDLDHYLDCLIEDYYVMEHGGHVIGAGGINYFQEEETARLSWDYFHPDYQGKGFGAELVRYRLRILSQHPSIRHVRVRTSQHTYLFYQKMGFILNKTEKDFWAKGIDLYQLDLPLLTEPTTDW